MTLRDALKPASSLRSSVVPRTAAIRGADKALVADDQLQRIQESLDLDAATRATSPQGNRWDYVLGVLGRRDLVALE